MDIVRVSDTSVKIKSKSASFLFNPDKKVEDEVVMLTQKPQDYSRYNGKIVIDAPGEYEISGVSIKGETGEKGISFDIFEDGQRLLVLSNPEVISTRDTEDADAVVVFLDGGGDALSKITSSIVAVVGSDEGLPVDRSNIKKADKISLKKAEEFKGFIVHLSR